MWGNYNSTNCQNFKTVAVFLDFKMNKTNPKSVSNSLLAFFEKS